MNATANLWNQTSDCKSSLLKQGILFARSIITLSTAVMHLSAHVVRQNCCPSSTNFVRSFCLHLPQNSPRRIPRWTSTSRRVWQTQRRPRMSDTMQGTSCLCSIPARTESHGQGESRRVQTRSRRWGPESPSVMMTRLRLHQRGRCYMEKHVCNSTLRAWYFCQQQKTVPSNQRAGPVVCGDTNVHAVAG